VPRQEPIHREHDGEFDPMERLFDSNHLQQIADGLVSEHSGQEPAIFSSPPRWGDGHQHASRSLFNPVGTTLDGAVSGTSADNPIILTPDNSEEEGADWIRPLKRSVRFARLNPREEGKELNFDIDIVHDHS